MRSQHKVGSPKYYSLQTGHFSRNKLRTCFNETKTSQKESLKTTREESKFTMRGTADFGSQVWHK